MSVITASTVDAEVKTLLTGLILFEGPITADIVKESIECLMVVEEGCRTATIVTDRQIYMREGLKVENFQGHHIYDPWYVLKQAD